MESWSNWVNLTSDNVKKIPKSTKGVYIIRTMKHLRTDSSDIIYIGEAGRKKQGVRERMSHLVRDVNGTGKKWKYHYASKKIKKYEQGGLQFSWFRCNRNPDGVEKSLLLGFMSSTGKLPVCNSKF
jgi:hypothetical protein